MLFAALTFFFPRVADYLARDSLRRTSFSSAALRHELRLRSNVPSSSAVVFPFYSSSFRISIRFLFFFLSREPQSSCAASAALFLGAPVPRSPLLSVPHSGLFPPFARGAAPMPNWTFNLSSLAGKEHRPHPPPLACRARWVFFLDVPSLRSSSFPETDLPFPGFPSPPCFP